MANFPTDKTTLDAFVLPFPMGSNWDGLTDAQRLQFNAATLTLWQTLDWHVSPFDNEAVRDQLNGLYAIHLRHIAEKDANPEEMLPKFIRALLLSWARFDGHVRGFPAIFPQAAEAAAAQDETPLTPSNRGGGSLSVGKKQKHLPSCLLIGPTLRLVGVLPGLPGKRLTCRLSPRPLFIM